jgi:hypothetical protein
MNQKGKAVAELGDEKWHWDFILLCDISHHVNDLHTNHQGQQKPISDMFWAFREFEMKLKLFRKELENVDLCHSYYCDLLYKDGLVSVLFRIFCAVELADSLAENF